MIFRISIRRLFSSIYVNFQGFLRPNEQVTIFDWRYAGGHILITFSQSPLYSQAIGGSTSHILIFHGTHFGGHPNLILIKCMVILRDFPLQ